MIYCLLYIIFFILICYVSFKEIVILSNAEYEANYTFEAKLILPILILLATLRPSFLPDYDNYEALFSGLSIEEERFEIGDLFLVNIARPVIDAPLFVFFIFAIVGISIKFYAIKGMTTAYYTSLLLYMANVFIIHDLIQIRCGIAVGLLLWAIKFKCDGANGNFWISAVLAVLFHYQALVIFPLFFLSPTNPHKFLYVFGVLFSYALALSGIGLATYVQLIGGESYAALFEHYVDKEDAVNLFNVVQLMKLFTFVIVMLNIEQLASVSKYAVMLMKVYALSICSLPLLADIPAAGFRISEFFQTVEILLVPMLVFIGGKKAILYRGWCYCYTIALFLIDAFYNKYLIEA